MYIKFLIILLFPLGLAACAVSSVVMSNPETGDDTLIINDYRTEGEMALNEVNESQAPTSIVDESDAPNRLPDYTIITEIDINPYVMFPTHEFKLEMWRLPEDSIYRTFGRQYEIIINIMGQRQTEYGISNTHQRIDGLLAGYGEGRWIEIDPKNPLNLHFADFNGDGYMDMALRCFPPQTGGMADDPHYFWLFNPRASSGNMFQRNHSLEYATGLGQIVSVCDGYVEVFIFTNVMYQYWVTYKYIDGEFIIVDNEQVPW